MLYSGRGRWDHRDAFDLGRDPSGHVGFGMGIRQCVGQHVARLEAEAPLTVLARRVISIEPAGPPRRHHNNTLRVFGSVPVRVRTALPGTRPGEPPPGPARTELRDHGEYRDSKPRVARVRT